jgi:hypothetical protein
MTILLGFLTEDLLDRIKNVLLFKSRGYPESGFRQPLFDTINGETED